MIDIESPEREIRTDKCSATLRISAKDKAGDASWEIKQINLTDERDQIIHVNLQFNILGDLTDIWMERDYDYGFNLEEFDEVRTIIALAMKEINLWKNELDSYDKQIGENIQAAELEYMNQRRKYMT